MRPSSDQAGAMSRPTTLIIMPAYNEEDSLPSVVAELKSHADYFDVLVVDDGSSDDTSRVARELGLRVAQLPFNLGVGGALRTGFLYASRHGYEQAVQFDADGQHVASEIQKLLDALDRGSDLVIGSRFAADEGDYRVGAVRGGAMRLLRIAVAIMTGRRFTDTSSGFRAFSRPLLEFFARSYPAEYLGDTVESLMLALVAGYRVEEVPVAMRERAGGSPSQNTIRLLYHYIRLLVVLSSSATLRARRLKGGAA